MALVLLALPMNVGRRFEPQPQYAGRVPRDAIDGDYRRVD
jgi:hypothetical protein